VALTIARELEKLAVGDARSKRMRGCTYRSRFFEGMYRDPELVSFLAKRSSRISDTSTEPSSDHV
jgi:hypothetical protein